MHTVNTQNEPLRYHIRTYGCQMNERDSEALACLLDQVGYLTAPSEAEADILLFNTCSVRDQAERKAVGKIGLMRKLKRENPDLVIVIIGCMAENLGQELLDRLPHVDLVVGTRQLHRLPELLAGVLTDRRRMACVGDGAIDFSRLAGHRSPGPSAYLAVMRGCNRYCTYCIVPHVRGREQSRSIPDIVREVRNLVGRGVKEIFLLGQNVTAYGVAEARRRGSYAPGASPFADLLRAIDVVPGVKRIRFTSPHPRFMNAAFVEAITSLPTVCEAFHIPLQSGSDRILGLMRRGYSAEDYRRIIHAIRERCPQAVFSTDIIVGFPSETEEEFAMTRALMTEIGFDMAYIFKYSPRPGTIAATMVDDVPSEVKLRRNKTLLEDLESRAETVNRRYLSTTIEVLVEGPSKRNPARWVGRSRANKVCLFEPVPELNSGDLAEFRVDRTTAHSLFGKIGNARCLGATSDGPAKG